MKGHFLKSKEIKELKQRIAKQWGAELPDYAFFMTEKNKIYVVSKDIAKLDLSLYRIIQVGMYFGELKNEQLRVTIEGSQVLGKTATKNVIALSADQMKAWLRGEDLELEADVEGFALVKQGTDFIGSGKYKDGKLLNFVPKARRLTAIDLPF